MGGKHRKAALTGERTRDGAADGNNSRTQRLRPFHRLAVTADDRYAQSDDVEISCDDGLPALFSSLTPTAKGLNLGAGSVPGEGGNCEMQTQWKLKKKKREENE